MDISPSRNITASRSEVHLLDYERAGTWLQARCKWEMQLIARLWYLPYVDQIIYALGTHNDA